ncbi:hypothetical protein EA772_05960 [Pedobacter sp. G11]|uniref:hypothetical protein n=1 Tax=Pedobacter sp. G11 TaxID=2482728 RepID=UPI000F5D6748|nr:hypothetical protein [Pedobacter sp. G11]AZI24913.1 hypothetical protein EA772_05960 [Pedobacter sp. G11]
MKLLFCLLVLCSIGVKAQTDLKFDKLLIDCEDKWVAVKAEDSIHYYFGFIYLDNSAGLTFNLEGTFRIDSLSRYIARKNKNMKLRLAPNKVVVAEIPASRLAELKVLAKPDWLSRFRTDDQNADRLFRWGSTYNRWGDAKKALKFLKQARSKDRNYPGLDREFFWAYNGQKQEVLANLYLGEALADVSEGRQTNCELYKSLVFKQTNSNQLKQAEEMYYYAIKECIDETAKADMAFNIAFQYYKLMNKEKLKQWENEVTRWIVPNESYSEKVKKMSTALN